MTVFAFAFQADWFLRWAHFTCLRVSLITTLHGRGLAHLTTLCCTVQARFLSSACWDCRCCVMLGSRLQNQLNNCNICCFHMTCGMLSTSSTAEAVSCQRWLLLLLLLTESRSLKFLELLARLCMTLFLCRLYYFFGVNKSRASLLPGILLSA